MNGVTQKAFFDELEKISTMGGFIAKMKRAPSKGGILRRLEIMTNKATEVAHQSRVRSGRRGFGGGTYTERFARTPTKAGREKLYLLKGRADKKYEAANRVEKKRLENIFKVEKALLNNLVL